MDSAALHAFLDELQKIAEDTAPAEDVQALEKTMKPGDILVGRLRSPGIGAAAVGSVLSAFQNGAKHYHAAMYIGDKKVVDINPGTGVMKRTLDGFADRYRFRALRVKAPKDIRDDAVAYAKKQVGKGYDMLGAVRQALPARSADKERQRQDVDSFFCSQLVANAYNKIPFSKDRHIGDVRPIDIQKSHAHVRVLGEVK